jgi:hypothetical protein
VTSSFSYSSQALLSPSERYRRPTRDRLELTARLTGPSTFREPLELKKVRRYAPEQEIAPYDREPAAPKTAERKTP